MGLDPLGTHGVHPNQGKFPKAWIAWFTATKDAWNAMRFHRHQGCEFFAFTFDEIPNLS